jgi:hypothetical protein
LSGQKEGFRKLTLAADFERSEILIPQTFRSLRFGLAPNQQLALLAAEIRCRKAGTGVVWPAEATPIRKLPLEKIIEREIAGS